MSLDFIFTLSHFTRRMSYLSTMKTIFLICMCIQGIRTSYSYGNYINLVVEIVKSYETPTAVTAFLCWKPHVKKDLANQLANLDQPSTIRFFNEQRISEPVPKDTLIVVDMKCPGVNDVLIKANETNMFGSPYRWLLLGQQSDEGSVVTPRLETLKILHDSEVIAVTEKPKGHFELYLIYKIRANQQWMTEYYGSWASSSSLQMSNLVMDTTKILRRRNLEEERLAVTFNVDDEEIGLRSTSDDYKIQRSLYVVTQWGLQLMIPLYEFLNATRINYFADTWGYFVNGSWNGIVGNMARGDAEISGTPIFMAKERLEHITYLMNPVRTSVKFVFREPPLSYQNNLFLLPFNTSVWYSLAVFVLLMIIVIYVYAQWEAKKDKIARTMEEDMKSQETKMTISDVAMIIIGAISQQGSFIELRGSIGRLVMFILFLTFLFLFTAYSASIVALLQSSSKQIRTLSDLLNSRLELGVENTSYNLHYFAIASDPVRKAIYETKVAPKGSKPKFMTLEEGIKKLQKHPFAFNMDLGVGYGLVEKYFYEHEKCGLQEIAYIPTSKPWLTCKKTSPHAELYKIGLFRIHEHGISDRANAQVFSKKPVCSVSGGGSFDSVSIVDVYPPLLMLLYGMMLACLLLAAEILLHRRRQKKTSQEFDDRTYTVTSAQ